MTGQTPILELKKLKKHFPLRRGASIKALEDVSLTVYEGEKFGIVGESGCGKSTLGRVVLQLYRQTSGVSIYYGTSLEAVAPRYLKREIARLPAYQRRAKRYYERAEALETRLQALEQAGKAPQKKLEALRQRAREYKKDASRQLREGSRTCGSLITSARLPEIQRLFAQAHEALTQAHRLLKDCARCEAEQEKNRLGRWEDPALAERIAIYRSQAEGQTNRARALREQAFALRDQAVLPITERCQDPLYRRKLDGNFETGINLGKLTGREMRHLRHDLQMIFQDPAASLDPRQSVGKAIEEVFRINTDFGPQVRRQRTLQLLQQVGLKEEHYAAYPHELSGGQKQRVGIARAIALGPKMVVLDESVSALDVSVRAQVLELLDELSRQRGLTYLFITHDLGVVKYFCDRLVVMYLGNVCELGTTGEIFHRALHPYTLSLLAAVPRPVVKAERGNDQVLQGEVPSAVTPPKGCPFHTRCDKCLPICSQQKPPLGETSPGHLTACFLYPAAVKPDKGED
ncbi:MAG: oligopeptide/dipeptide ABC transporter ATP-binding protein [Christensenellales bacterium]